MSINKKASTSGSSNFWEKHKARKIIKTESEKSFDKNSMLWLIAKRKKINFNHNFIKYDDLSIKFNEMEDLKIYNYKSFIYFNIFFVITFKFKNLYYQIGISKKERDIIVNSNTSFKEISTKNNYKDIVIILIIIVCTLYIYFIN